MGNAEPAVAPADVFYVVESVGPVTKREHQTRSPLYETRHQAEAERVRLMRSNPAKEYSVWKHTTYIEPPEWLSDVVMEDGRVIRAQR